MWIPLLLAEGDDNQWMVLVLIAGAGAIMWSLSRHRKKTSASSSFWTRHEPSSAAPADPGAGQRRQEFRESMQSLMLELEQLSREINSQVDTRLRALNLLIQEADEKIKELKLLQGDEGASPTRNLPPPREEPHGDATRDRYARVYALAEQGRSVVEIARELGLMSGEVELILALRRTAGAGAGERTK